jgi:hypothetical protein
MSKEEMQKGDEVKKIPSYVWKCPECNCINTESYLSSKFFKLPKILVIQLKRFRVSKTGYCTLDNTQVEYDRYMTLKHGNGNYDINYELIGLVVFQGHSITAGHYVSYILHSSNQWYFIDDTPDDPGLPIPSPVVVSAKTVLEQKNLAYLFFYRKIPENELTCAIKNDVIDMIIDTYGNNITNHSNTNNVAVALKFPFNTKKPEKPSRDCVDIIKAFKLANIQNLGEFLKFINRENNKIKMHFWRLYIEEDVVKNSCVGNGTCGYQLEFLLHWRADNHEGNYPDYDRWMKGNNHISKSTQTKEFIHYLNNVLYHSQLSAFQDIEKPTISSTITKNNNTFRSLNEWLASRLQKRRENLITDEVLNREMIYFKYQTLYDWILQQITPSPTIINQQTIIWSKGFPRDATVGGQQINVWYSATMFKYTKRLHNFSLFQNTTDLRYPHINGYYILFYSTNCEDVKHDYNYTEVIVAADNLNHGFLDDNGKDNYPAHYSLAKTYPFSIPLKNSLTSLFQRMNYILKYGEFDPNFNLNKPLLRWGIPPKKRAYESTFSVTSSPTPIPTIETKFNIQAKEDEFVETIKILFREYYNSRNTLNFNSNISNVPITQKLAIQVLPTKHKKVVEVEESIFIATDIKLQLFDVLFPNFLTFMNNKLSKDQLRTNVGKHLKMVYQNNKSTIQNDNTLNTTLSKAVIDLTKDDDDDEENNLTNTPTKEQSTIIKYPKKDDENNTPPIKGNKTNKNKKTTKNNKK